MSRFECPENMGWCRFWALVEEEIEDAIGTNEVISLFVGFNPGPSGIGGITVYSKLIVSGEVYLAKIRYRCQVKEKTTVVIFESSQCGIQVGAEEIEWTEVDKEVIQKESNCIDEISLILGDALSAFIQGKS